jgi:hypothetical protein
VAVENNCFVAADADDRCLPIWRVASDDTVRLNIVFEIGGWKIFR